MTILARSNLPLPPGAEIRLAHQACPESRIVALRAAIADGSYRIDTAVIAARLIATLHERSDFCGKHH